MNLRACDVGVTVLKVFGALFLIMAVVAVAHPIFCVPIAAAPEGDCMSNMKQIARAILDYAADYDDKLPFTRAPGGANGIEPEPDIDRRPGVIPFSGDTWVKLIDPYVPWGSIKDAKRGIMTGVYVCPEQGMKWPKGVGQSIPDWHSYGYNFLFLGLPWHEDRSPKTNPYRAWKFTAGAPKIESLEDTADTILLVESRSIWAYPPFTNGGRVLLANATCISPRHNGRVNVAFCDGHVRAMDPSELVATGRPLKVKGTEGIAVNDRLWDPIKGKYPEEMQ